MATLEQSPIVAESFAIIDHEIGDHRFDPATYAVLRRVIHSTGDFDYQNWLVCSPTAITQGIAALGQGCPIVVDVSMVRQGVRGLVQRTFQNPLMTAVDQGSPPLPGHTRTASGLLRCWPQVEGGVVVVGNAPTALIALCEQVAAGKPPPALVIGAPVGFVAVEAAKQRLAQLAVPQIRIDGRKGGSAAAAAILNALLILAWEQQ